MQDIDKVFNEAMIEEEELDMLIDDDILNLVDDEDDFIKESVNIFNDDIHVEV